MFFYWQTDQSNYLEWIIQILGDYVLLSGQQAKWQNKSEAENISGNHKKLGKTNKPEIRASTVFSYLFGVQLW